MKKIYSLLIAGMVVTACENPGNNSKTLEMSDRKAKAADEKPVSMSYEEGLNYKKDDHKLVEIEGYVQLSVISNFTEKGQTVNFYGRKNQMEGADYYTTMPIGKGKNQMIQLPLKYKNSDVKMTDDEGKTVLANERVRLTGYIYKLGETSYMDVIKIHKVPEVVTDYAALNFPVLQEKNKTDEKSYEKGYQLEGKLSVPMFVLIDDETTVDLKDKNGKTFSLKVMTGTGSSQIEELKEGWTNKDVKIRNDQGKLVNTGKNVKVYGVLKLDGLHVESIVQ